MSTKYDVVMDRYKINLIPFITLILQVTMIKAISKLQVHQEDLFLQSYHIKDDELDWIYW